MFGKNQRVQPSDTVSRGKKELTKGFRTRGQPIPWFVLLYTSRHRSLIGLIGSGKWLSIGRLRVIPDTVRNAFTSIWVNP
jgi:hypothetical protein